MSTNQRRTPEDDQAIRLPDDARVRENLRAHDVRLGEDFADRAERGGRLDTVADYEAIVLRELLSRRQVTRSAMAGVLAGTYGSVDAGRLDEAFNRVRALARTPEEDAVRRIPNEQLSTEFDRAQKQVARIEQKMGEGAPDPAVLRVWRDHLRQARALLTERVRREPKLSLDRDLARIAALERRLDGDASPAGIPASVPAAPARPLVRTRVDIARAPDYSRISVAYQGLHAIGVMLDSAKDAVARMTKRIDAGDGVLGKVAQFLRVAGKPAPDDLVRRLKERETEKYRVEILELVLRQNGEVTREQALQELSRTRAVNAQEFDRIWKEIVSSIWSSNIPGETSGL